MFIEDLKTLLEITDNSKDSILQIYEKQAIEKVKSIIGEFEEKTIEGFFEAKNHMVFISALNLSVIEISSNTGTEFAKNWSVFDSSNYYLENGIIKINFNGEVKVKYKVGFSTSSIPENIKQSILILTKDFFEGEKIKKEVLDGNKVKKESVDGDSVEYQSVADSVTYEINPRTLNIVNDLLSKYKRYDFQA